MNHNQQTVGALEAVDLVGLGQFICGLSLGELRNLSTAAFRLVADTALAWLQMMGEFDMKDAWSCQDDKVYVTQ